jgi:hypothetical protein
MKAVKEVCGKKAGFANSKSAEAKAKSMEESVYKLGIDFETYMQLAVSICVRNAKKNGWPYPYWSLVTADWVYDKIHKMVKELEWSIQELPQHGSLDATMFELELLYAVHYIQWKQGLADAPIRLGLASAYIIQKVMDYIKIVHGLFGVTRTYDQLYSLIEANNA